MNLIEKIPFVDIYDKRGICELDTFEEAILIIKNFKKYKKNMVIVKNNLFSATKLYEELLINIDEEDIHLFGFDESLVVETLASSPELAMQRLDTIKSSQNNNPMIIITHSMGIIKPIISKEEYLNNIRNLKIDDEIDFKEIGEYLISVGFNKVSKVTLPFEFSIRGNVLDIYGISNSQPVRIDTFDTIIESFKLFDVNTQRSRIKLDEYQIYPVSVYNQKMDTYIYEKITLENKNENLADELLASMTINKELFLSRYYNLVENKNSILDYIDDPILITSSMTSIKANIENIHLESYSYLKEQCLENKAYCDFEIFLDYQILLLHSIDIKEYRTKLVEQSLDLYPIIKINDNSQFIEMLKENLKENLKIFISLEKHHDLNNVISLLDDNELEYNQNIYEDGNINILREEFTRGFKNEEYGIVLYTEKEIFAKKVKRSKFFNKFSNAVDIVNLEELKENDYVVHNHHGIGQYLGLVQLKVDNIEKDFLHIAYRNNEKLYIPIDQFNLIKKYSTSDSIPPKISALGGSDWKKTKLKVAKKIEDMMDELLELYATRQQPIGFSFAPDTPLQKEFEDDFEYQLTPDQQKAIEEVKKDMESDKAMDRLICGDVGYGKTEVAIRAIMKAVLNNKQVSFLCPTTILARQHYLTLLEKFKNYPINIVLLTRNTTTKVVKSVITDLKDKKIDIVVGTHKLLGKSIEYNDLGLLVVDEEQRFGVKDKEKIKQLKTNIDVLTLSATPIPRTLQMSLSGLRPMSLLQTPPLNRVPVQTYVVEKNKYLIKEAIERELLRNGQVFYLYNKTKDIDLVALGIEDLFKEHNVKVGVIHGKMPKAEIERTMEMFDQNEYNILVTTTIIETGIDIPNANTIIIEDANNFGLSQLYQIKGRVGRSDRVAYAYMLYKKNKILTPEATKRLQAIKELTKLGSGYKIALRDLAIRGAGDILGKTQAGNIESVGYDLYIEMLQEAVNKKQNKVVKNTENIENINIKNTGYIPDTYQMDDNNKIRLYQKIYKVKEIEQFKEVEEEIRDQYGKLPSSIIDIIDKRKFEIIISRNKAIKVIDDLNKLTLQLQINIKDKELIKKIMNLADEYSGLIQIEVKYQKMHLSINKVSAYLRTVNILLQDLEKLVGRQYGN
ncbi:transcription-repair coupling factor [Mycoplasma sp. P36-A1]|uniref:transcription-repair coupling factor n=1 Tax=Mycoplasma sp. P36-A1 TaxID=3252900 RepID=UPI003C2C8B0D